MDFLKRHLKKIIQAFLFYSYILFYKVFSRKPKPVFCECCMSYSYRLFRKVNWGDELNKYMFEFASDVRIINLPFTKWKFTKNCSPFSLIGSILNLYNLDKKTIYGSGVMDPDALIMGKPEKIISVRGPETRKVLLRHGIDCPENYGDPALLLPCFYSANKIKKYKGGLIMNMGTKEKDNVIIQQIKNYLDLHVINIANYSEWTDVIDEICSCDYIISESLHGLITAETYGVPNVWVEFIDHPDYWNFKFLDFYESINKDEKIIQLQKGIDLEYIEAKINNWKKGNIDYKNLLELYPFDIKKSNEVFVNSI